MQKERDNREAMNVSFDIKLQPKDLHRFNIYQSYRGTQGILSILLALVVFIISAVCFGQGRTAYGILYLAGAFLLLLYIPVTLWLRAKHTLQTNEVLAGVLHYEVSEACIRVTQGTEAGELPWEHIYKMVSTKKQILIYSNRINAYIIPREQLGSRYDELKQLASGQLEHYRFRMK